MARFVQNHLHAIYGAFRFSGTDSIFRNLFPFTAWCLKYFHINLKILIPIRM